ncbi:MAG: dihydroorotate dehydrogenase [candidate division WOR-3 bacterium]|uniref:Dihydroorotate dehydrogenase n=1 Tax=candidate division WOR-3 bacterium TaxID=2052148 RepID=A0A7C2B8S8_UNCW3|nr:dihydroorotate dehydrogenase [candidate division WOR-3 bacterium]
MNLEVMLAGVKFRNPVIAASGTFGFGLEYRQIAQKLGGIVTKAITLEPRAGNPMPRIAEVCGGIVNSVGLENPGIQRFKTEILPRLRNLKSRLIVNIAGSKTDEFVQIAEMLEEDQITALELNLSCPNVREGGVLLGQNPKLVKNLTSAVRKRTRKLLIVKLTANFVDPAVTARAAEDSGADAVTVINTLFGLVLDENGQPLLGGRTGGLSGPAIKPFALFCVDRVAAAVKIPVIGCGGIMNGQDAYEFLCAGAKMVQVGTANLITPDRSWKIVRELAVICRLKKSVQFKKVRKARCKK